MGPVVTASILSMHALYMIHQRSMKQAQSMLEPGSFNCLINPEINQYSLKMKQTASCIFHLVAKAQAT
jgi:hypothetical protein